jgi:predicted transglutaminase-like cysteine proteinase
MANIYETLSAIHSKVYKGFKYETDQDQFGTIEKWVMPTPEGITHITGDCEDFALACRVLCREAGIQSRLVVCTADGEGHCVLEANGWIFDCNSSTIVSRDSLDYKWYYISGYNPRDDWKMITN